MLASASTAIVVGFNVEADANARRVAEAEGVSIRLYNIIYRLIEDVEKALKGMLEPELKEVVLGQAVIQAVFGAKKLGNVAGCKVVKGELRRNGRSGMRGGQVIHEGEVASLRHEKDDVQEVRTGFECGVGIRNYSDYAVGDTPGMLYHRKAMVAGRVTLRCQPKSECKEFRIACIRSYLN